MLIGNNNSVNERLVSEFSSVAPVTLVNPNDFLNNTQEVVSNVQPHIAILNLMDVGNVENELLAVLKEQFPQLRIIAIHSFLAEHLIQKTLEKGYDSYVSIFEVSDKMYSVLNEYMVN